MDALDLHIKNRFRIKIDIHAGVDITHQGILYFASLYPSIGHEKLYCSLNVLSFSNLYKVHDPAIPHLFHQQG